MRKQLAKVKIKVSATGVPSSDLIISVRSSLDGMIWRIRGLHLHDWVGILIG